MKRVHVFILIVFILMKPALTHAVGFSDVSSENDFADAIEYLLENKIAEGYADGTFKPDSLISRAEFTKIVVSAYGYDSYDFSLCFPIGELSPPREIQRIPQDSIHILWAAPYICLASRKGMINGYPDGTFRPNNHINFAEAAKILAKSFLGTPEHIRSTSSDDEWFISYVKDLAEANVIPVSIHRFDQKITRGEMSEMIYRLKSGIEEKTSTTYEELADPSNVSVRNSGLPANWSYQPIIETPFELPLPPNAEILKSKDGTIDIYPLSTQDRSKNSIYSFYLSFQVCDPGAWCNAEGPGMSLFPIPRSWKSENDDLNVNFYAPGDSFRQYIFGIRHEGVGYIAQMHLIVDGVVLPSSPEYLHIDEAKAEAAVSLMRYIRLSSE